MDVTADRLIPRNRERWRIRPTSAALVVLGAGAAAFMLAVSPAALPVVVPLCAIFAGATAFMVHLHSHDGALPVFDIGALTVFATALYSAVPLLGFWLADLRWTAFSYLPLWLYYPSPSEVGGFAWRHVLYLYAFMAAYLLFRGRMPIRSGPTRELRPTAVAAMVLLIAGLLSYFELLRIVFGVSYDPSYSDLAADGAAMAALPHVVRQLSHNLFAIMVLFKVALLAWLMSRWTDWRWRGVLIAWLLLEGVLTVTRMGGRTWYATLIMAAVLLYHRLVRPLPAARAATLAGLLLAGTLVYGLARDIGGGIRTVAEADHTPWATMNEFQALFGISYDLKMRKDADTLGTIPWEIYASDFLRLIPSQLLPFEKADPCLGYPQVDGVGLGCVLGVISNAIIGLDWVELLARGLLLGCLFALLHRWYARRQNGYWTTLFYLCMCLWSYYTFRASSFYFLYYVVYRFIPLVLAVRVTQILLRHARRGLAAAGV